MLTKTFCFVIAMTMILTTACIPSESPNTAATPIAVDPGVPFGSLMPADPNIQQALYLIRGR